MTAHPFDEKYAVDVVFVRDTDGEIVAVFPNEKYSSFSDDVVMYLHNGQHTNGDLEWAREHEIASPIESKDLRAELESIGYVLTDVTL